MRRSWQFISTVLGIIFRHPVTGVTLIPILPDGKIVFVRRHDTGQWSLPGGMVDWGEDIPTTVRRELEEETGLTLVKMGRLIGVYSAADRDPRLHSISVAIEVYAEGVTAAQDALEIAEAKPFDLSSIPYGHLSHDHDRQLRDYLDGLTRIA
ncbi:NUDIX hydrolase [Lusitaniella coriacea LEGE 07157]|uniref:NUDIX hydrolase n=1 Tax=Lusitaniella coriacea LEGE 07157 TaxID=945747 RepID=A0A8J7DW22_9CYAN|nr:NUDIX hydrolase [Lusitaniella coriacea]MBE9115818.1 NUDIX hydrolase [Lusitaniella coriacea LEGE 07157]